MKVSTRLFLLSAVFVILIAGLGYVMFRTTELINIDVRDSDEATQIIRDVFELSIVTFEYLSHHEERMEQQWLLKYESLGNLLEDMRAEETHAEDIAALETIASDYESLGNFFSLLLDNLDDRTRLIEENGSQAEIDLTLASEERLAAQTLIESQRMASEAFKLSETIQQRIDRVQQRANSIALVSIVVFIALAFYISFVTIRAITGPLNALVASAETIGKGDFEHRVDIKTSNEIGILAEAFNRMAENLVQDNRRRRQAEVEIRTLNVELEQRVIERTAELKAANEELEAFSYSVSHDLRAPLRAIDGFSQMLQEDHAEQVDAEGKDHLRRVRSAAHRMAELIDDLLDLSRVTRAEIHRENVDLSELAQKIMSELEKSEPERQVELLVQDNLFVNGDSSLLRVALGNLLRNAWKFTRERTPARIEFGIEEQDGQRVYFVKDNGAGFDMEYADKLFGPFQRLHSATEFPGTGVGLASVQRIIHRHGGQVWAEAEVDQGATFCFTL
jgi:signal transduction histidine kinase